MDKRVLIVDDEDLIRQGMVARLQYLNLKPVQLRQLKYLKINQWILLLQISVWRIWMV